MNKFWDFINIVVKFFMNLILKILKIEWNDKQWNAFLQFVRFGIVGLSNTFIAYFFYEICILLGANYILANFISFVISVLNSFYWNNKYVFVADENEKRSSMKTLTKTLITYGITGLVLNSILLIFWIDFVHISKHFAPIINLIITIPLNFIINKFWAYKTK